MYTVYTKNRHNEYDQNKKRGDQHGINFLPSF